MKSDEPLLIDGKTIEEWDRLWAPVVGGLTMPQPDLRSAVGLYRCSLGGRISALGTGTDKRRGLEKRFYDFMRPGDSSRNYFAGRQIYKHLDQLQVEVLITGSDWQARKIAKRLWAPMIQLHNPAWNVRRVPYKAAPSQRPKGAGVKAKVAPYTGTIPKG